MKTDLEVEFRNRLLAYLTHQIRLAAFEDWLANVSMEVPSEHPLTRRVFEAELRLAEYSNGHLDEDDLRSQLAPLVLGQPLVVGGDGATVGGSSELRSSSMNTLSRPTVMLSGPLVLIPQ